MSREGAEPKPEPSGGPSIDWEHRKLYDDVIQAIYALPEEFETSLHISDFRATDIFTLNTALGASIEDSVVRGLNRLREVWDADGKYAVYRFERQSQAFPDVRLVTEVPDKEPCLMGIELKGWFAMSKEGEPTFRYQVTPRVCADADLLVVFPWVLSDVVAGAPKLLNPFLTEARYAAELRNWYWRDMRIRNGGNPGITLAKHQTPYPSTKVDQCSDRADVDGGGNFGRVARYGLMSDWIRSIAQQHVSGIPVIAWLSFFKLFSDKADLDQITDTIESELHKFVAEDDTRRESLADAFARIVSMLKGESLEE
ncbi:MAG TPA: hypothetical protein ENI94_06685 [Gammaproteobacteria bacterium]|nr:hypothetical protein [Gammaproteobacteria bacterium]